MASWKDLQIQPEQAGAVGGLIGGGIGGIIGAGFQCWPFHNCLFSFRVALAVYGIPIFIGFFLWWHFLKKKKLRKLRRG